jgi:hypothetical protein
MTSPILAFNYTFHAPNVHELVLRDSQPATLDAFFAQLDLVMGALPQGEVLRLVLHTTHVNSVQYMMPYRRALKQKYPHIQRPRIAIVYPQSLQVYLINIVARAMTNSASVRMFHPHQTAEALAWAAGR